MHTCKCLAPFLHSYRLGNGATHLSASHPILVNIIKIIPQIITQKAISQMILHFFNLAIKINHHNTVYIYSTNNVMG